MSEQKRYTEQGMRDTAQCLHYNSPTKLTIEAAAMLRQAADSEEELAKAKRPDACPANPTNKMCYLPGEYCCDSVRYLQKENAKLRVDADLYKGASENWERKYRSAEARLDAVVKECEKQIPECRGEEGKCNPTDSGYCDENCHDEIIVHTAVTAILRAARGEGGAE